MADSKNVTSRALRLKKDNYIDTTKTGPLSYRQLQQLNSDLPDASREYMENDYGAGIRQSISQPSGFHMTPVPYNYDIGESAFDKGIYNSAEAEDYQDIRAENEPAILKAVNGILKGGLLAGTTIVDGTLGLVTGIAEWGIQGDFSRLWDNEVTQMLDFVNKEAERLLPNYYTSEELNTPWYTNMASANFIFDKFVKNIGFTVGAAYSGGIYAKGIGGLINWGAKLAGLGKAVTTAAKVAETGIGTVERAKKYATIFERAWNMNNKIRGAKALTGATLGAVAEGTVEAVSNSNDMINLQRQELKDKAYKDKQTYFEEYKDNIYNGMPEEQARAIYEEKVAKVDKAIEDAEVVMEEHRKKMGSADLLMNIPILTLDNIYQFGKLWTGGYKAARNNTKTVLRATKEAKKEAREAWKNGDKSVRENLNAIIKKANTSKRGWGALTEAEKALVEEAPRHLLGDKASYIYAMLKAPAREANEEMAQGFAAESSGIYHKAFGDYVYESAIHPESAAELKDTIGDFWGSAKEGFMNTYGNLNRWEEGFIGALTGALGSPTFGRKTNSTDQTWLGKGKMIGMSGGAFIEARDYKKNRENQDKAAAEITRILRDPKTVDRFRHVTAQIKFDKDKRRGASLGDKRMFKDAETAALFEDIMYAKKTGNLDKYKQLMNSALEASDEDIDFIIEATQKEISAKDDNVNQHALKIQSLDTAMRKKEEEEQRAFEDWREAADRNESPDVVETLYNRIQNLSEQRLAMKEELDRALIRYSNADAKQVSPYVHSDGTAFTREEVKEELQNRAKRGFDLIDEISEVQDTIDRETSEVMSDEHIATMTYYEIAKRDWSRRGQEILDSFKQDLVDNKQLSLIAEESRRRLDELEKQFKTKLPKNIRKEVLDSIKALEAITSWADSLLNKNDSIIPILAHNGVIKVKDDEGNEKELDAAKLLYDILTDAANMNSFYTEYERQEKLKDIEDLKKIVESYKKYDEDLSNFMKDSSAIDKMHKNTEDRVTSNKKKTLFEDIKKSIDFSNPDSIRTVIENNKSAIQEAGGLKEFLNTLTKEEKLATKKALNIKDLKDYLNNNISKSNANDDVKEYSKRVVKSIDDIDMTSEGMQRWLTDGDKLDAAIKKAAEEAADEKSIIDEVSRAAYVATMEEQMKELLTEQINKANEIASRIEEENRKEVEEVDRQVKGHKENKREGDRIPEKAFKEASKPDMPSNIAENHETSESKVKQERKKNKDTGLKQLEKLEGFERRRQFTEFYIYGTDGMTLYDYYSQHKDKIPAGVDKEEFLDYIKRVSEFLSKEGAHTRVSGINKEDRLKENDTLIFEVEPSLSKNNVDVVVIKTKDGRVVGTIRSKYEFDAYDHAVQNGESRNKAIEAQRELYNAVIAQSKESNSEPISTTVESLNRGSLPLSTEDSTIEEIFDDEEPIIGIVTGTAGNYVINVGDRNIKIAEPEDIRPGQVYVLIPSNTGTYIPAMCYSTPISDLSDDDWYIQEAIDSFMSMIQSTESILKEKESFTKWLPIGTRYNNPDVGNFHCNLQKHNPDYDKEDKNSHKYLNVNTLEEADVITVSFTDMKGKNKKFTFSLLNKNGSRKTDEQIRDTIAKTFIKNTAKANKLQVNIDKRRLKDKEYIKKISEYYQTNLIPGSKGRHSMNDGFLYKPTDIEVKYEEQNRKFNSKSEVKTHPTLGTVREVVFNGNKYTIDSSGTVRDNEGNIVDTALKNSVIESLNPKKDKESKSENEEKKEDDSKEDDSEDKDSEDSEEEDDDDSEDNNSDNKETGGRGKLKPGKFFGRGRGGSNQRRKRVPIRKQTVQEKEDEEKIPPQSSDEEKKIDPTKLHTSVMDKIAEDSAIISFYKLNRNSSVSVGEIIDIIVANFLYSNNKDFTEAFKLFTATIGQSVNGNIDTIVNAVQATLNKMMLTQAQIKALRDKAKDSLDRLTQLYNEQLEKLQWNNLSDSTKEALNAKEITEEIYNSYSAIDKYMITKCH